LIIFVVRIWTVLAFKISFHAFLFVHLHMSMEIVAPGPSLVTLVTVISSCCFSHNYSQFVKKVKLLIKLYNIIN
jgi:hypothetical protein